MVGAGEEFVGHGRIVLHATGREGAVELRVVAALRVEDEGVDGRRQLAHVPPEDLTVGRRRKELAAGLGVAPEDGLDRLAVRHVGRTELDRTLAAAHVPHAHRSVGRPGRQDLLVARVVRQTLTLLRALDRHFRLVRPLWNKSTIESSMSSPSIAPVSSCGFN